MYKQQARAFATADALRVSGRCIRLRAGVGFCFASLTTGMTIDGIAVSELAVNPGLKGETWGTHYSSSTAYPAAYLGGSSQQLGVECEISNSSSFMSTEISANKGVLR
jgi:hypothetical protein